MIKKYNENEFVVNGVEIREIEYSKEWEDDDTWFEYTIDFLEAYINGNQVDVEDDSIMSDELWNLITKKLNGQINQEEADYCNKLNI